MMRMSSSVSSSKLRRSSFSHTSPLTYTFSLPQVQMNNFVINGVEIDSFNINAPDFKISMFQNFHGRFYSALALTEKLASQYFLFLS